MCIAPPPPIEISGETTIITEPLTADGLYVDYLQYTKNLIGESNPNDDLWKALVSPNRPNDESTNWAISQAHLSHAVPAIRQSELLVVGELPDGEFVGEGSEVDLSEALLIPECLQHRSRPIGILRFTRRKRNRSSTATTS